MKDLTLATPITKCLGQDAATRSAEIARYTPESISAIQKACQCEDLPSTPQPPSGRLKAMPHIQPDMPPVPENWTLCQGVSWETSLTAHPKPTAQSQASTKTGYIKSSKERGSRSRDSSCLGKATKLTSQSPIQPHT